MKGMLFSTCKFPERPPNFCIHPVLPPSAARSWFCIASGLDQLPRTALSYANLRANERPDRKEELPPPSQPPDDFPAVPPQFPPLLLKPFRTLAGLPTGLLIRRIAVRTLLYVERWRECKPPRLFFLPQALSPGNVFSSFNRSPFHLACTPHVFLSSQWSLFVSSSFDFLRPS